MKRFLFNLSAVAMTSVVLISCSGSKNQDDASGNGAVAATMEEAVALTSDMTVAEVKGNVQSVTVSVFEATMNGGELKPSDTPLEVISYGFDQQGRLTAYSDKFNNGSYTRYDFSIAYADDSFNGKITNLKDKSRQIVIERDADNRITRLADSHSTDTDRDEAWSWTDGRLTEVSVTCWEWSEGWTLTYDDKGLVATRVDTWEEYEEGSEVTSTYTYVKFDDHGNWIERSAKIDQASTAWDNESEKMVTTATEPVKYQVESRVISYF